MSATTTWKCPNDGLVWDRSKYRKCPTCGYANMPACVALVSAKTGKTAELGTNTPLGRDALKQKFGDDEARFADPVQFEIVKDTEAAVWWLRPNGGAVNPTHYNGRRVPEGGCELTADGVITVGKSKMKLTVRFT